MLSSTISAAGHAIAAPPPGDPILSTFRSATDADHVVDALLSTIVERIRSAELAERCTLIRQAFSAAGGGQAGKAAISEMKKPLPAITIAGRFTRRANVAWVAPSDLVGIDLDDLPPDRLTAAWQALVASPHVVLLYHSPSGAGIKGAVRVPALGGTDQTGYAAAWRAVGLWLASLGLDNDPAVKDVSRLAFLAHDPQAHLNLEAVPLDVMAWTPALPVDPQPAEPANRLRPGDDFNRRENITPVLLKHGWKLDHVAKDGNQHWTRPGKNTGTSATLKDGVFYVFSSSLMPVFQPNQGYSPFSVFALLEYDGDFAAAAKQLRQHGFGEQAAGKEPEAGRGLAFTCFTETEERKPDWLWRGYLLRGATAVVGGRQGTSKGLFTIDIAARLTRGDTMPDGSGGGTPIKVLIVTREDDANLALKPRLRIAGADMSRIYWSYGDFTDRVPIPTMAVAADHIATVVQEQGIGLVIIDPLGAWVEEDANNGQQIRAVIDPMNRVVRATGCAVIFVAHLRKAGAEDPMDAFAGSVQVTAACRTAILIAPTMDGSERLVQVVKTNFRRPDAPLLYQLQFVSPDPDDPPRLEWRLATGEDLAVAATAKAGAGTIVPVATVLEHLPNEHRPIKDVARAIRKTLLPVHRGITVQAVMDALVEAITTGKAHAGEDARGARTVGMLPPVPAETATDRAIAYWEANPESSVRQVAKATGCSTSAAGRARILVRSCVPRPRPMLVERDASDGT